MSVENCGVALRCVIIELGEIVCRVERAVTERRVGQLFIFKLQGINLVSMK